MNLLVILVLTQERIYLLPAASSIIQANIFGIFACNMSIHVLLAVFETVSVCQLKLLMCGFCVENNIEYLFSLGKIDIL